MQWFNDSMNFLKSNDWVAQVFLIILTMLIINFVVRRLLDKALTKLDKTKNPWDNLLLTSIIRPLSLLIWLLGLTFAADVMHAESGAAIFQAIGPIRDVGVIIIISIFVLQLIKGTQEVLVLEERETGERDFDKHTVEAIGKLLRISVILTSALVILQTLGYSISGVLAFGGIGGIAVGFAAKDLLSNFFGGLMIYLDRPFTTGNWIRSNDRDIEGVVEHIGWRLTRIRTFEKRPLYVPNSVFMNITVENPSRMTNRRIKETVGVRYGDADKVATIVEEVKVMLKSHPDIDQDQIILVNLVNYAPSSLDFFVYVYTKTIDWATYHEVKQDVMMKIIEIIDRNGAEIAFPTSTLHVESLPITEPQ